MITIYSLIGVSRQLDGSPSSGGLGFPAEEDSAPVFCCCHVQQDVSLYQNRTYIYLSLYLWNMNDPLRSHAVSSVLLPPVHAQTYKHQWNNVETNTVLYQFFFLQIWLWKILRNQNFEHNTKIWRIFYLNNLKY